MQGVAHRFEIDAVALGVRVEEEDGLSLQSSGRVDMRGPQQQARYIGSGEGRSGELERAEQSQEASKRGRAARKPATPQSSGRKPARPHILQASFFLIAYRLCYEIESSSWHTLRAIRLTSFPSHLPDGRR